MIAVGSMKLGKAVRPSDVLVEMTSASGEVGIRVIIKLCQHVLGGKGLLDEWQISVLVLRSRQKLA